MCLSLKQTRIVPALLAWFARNARDLPWRRSRDPYAIWVAEIMLQQTRVGTVLDYWKRWMQALPDLPALAKARPQTLHKLWEGLGYYARVRNLHRAAQNILATHGGQFPRRFASVLALPGIGRYTAGAVCSIAFNQPQPVLDGNVIRVLTRLFAIGGDPRQQPTNAKLWQLAHTLVLQAAAGGGRNSDTGRPPAAPRSTAPARCSHFNQALMELGAVVCTPRQPRCVICPVAEHCLARRQGRVGEFPQSARRPQASPRRFAAFVVLEQGRFLVRQRPAGVVNAHLWEFPNVEVAPGEAGLERAALAALGSSPSTLEPFRTIRHSITRYRITLEVFRAARRVPVSPLPFPGRWLRLSQLHQLPFTAAHKKILQAIPPDVPRRTRTPPKSPRPPIATPPKDACLPAGPDWAPGLAGTTAAPALGRLPPG